MLDMGDAAYRFNIVPGIPVAVLYWVGDDEFPPEAKILYDRSISGQWPLDIVPALFLSRDRNLPERSFSMHARY